MSRIQVNITAKVNTASIRRETIEGREHWVIPSYTLPFNVVMNDVMYPREEILRTYASLDSTLAPLGHPMKNGEFISAFSPEGINIGHIGAWNRNAKISGNRVYLEKWLDIEVAKRTDKGRELLERLEAIEGGEDVPPIHTSVAAFIDALPAEEGAGYSSIAKIYNFDHDAILLSEVGAATPEQGVGLMVNADEARPIAANRGALAGLTFRDRERLLDAAARERFVKAEGDYAWVVDFTDTQAVLLRNANDSTLYEYEIKDGKVVFGDAGKPVERQESWVEKIPALNALKNFFTNQQARPATTKEGDMPLTNEEKAEIIAANQTAVKDLLAPLTQSLLANTEAIAAIAAVQKADREALAANAKAAEDGIRKEVAAVHGDMVANALTGEALKDLHSKLPKAPNVANTGNGQQTETGLNVTDFGAHFGDTKEKA